MLVASYTKPMDYDENLDQIYGEDFREIVTYQLSAHNFPLQLITSHFQLERIDRIQHR
jgi:hypothetical protein